jgi:hypothetical protein
MINRLKAKIEKVREEDYCEECGCYVCEEHNTNLMNLSTVHRVEDHWAEE